MAELITPDVNPAPGPGVAEAAGAADDANKVFAGNLAFATTEDELKSIFAEAGTVTHIQIIKRGTRSLGYGFVTYATEAEAQKAVSTLDKRELGGREINVEGAKPQLMAKHNDSGNYTDGEGKEGGDKAGRGGRARRARGARGGRGGASSRRPRTDEGEEGLEDPVKENGGEARKPKKTNGAAGAAANAVPRKPKGPPEGEPSKTLLFVANLPFQFTDEQLKSAFDGFQVKTAKVIKRRFGPRTKGFGFVDLETEEEQQRALKEVQGKVVEGRAVSLKVAIQGQDRSAVKEEEAEAAAEASGAPAA